MLDLRDSKTLRSEILKRSKNRLKGNTSDLNGKSSRDLDHSLITVVTQHPGRAAILIRNQQVTDQFYQDYKPRMLIKKNSTAKYVPTPKKSDNRIS